MRSTPLHAIMAAAVLVSAALVLRTAQVTWGSPTMDPAAAAHARSTAAGPPEVAPAIAEPLPSEPMGLHGDLVAAFC